MGVLVQIVGSLLVLAAFVLTQFHVLSSDSKLFLSLNVVGSGVLAVDALLEDQWGFLLLEGVWAIVSAVSLVRLLASRKPRPAGSSSRSGSGSGSAES